MSDPYLPIGALVFAPYNPDVFCSFVATDGSLLVPPANNPSFDVGFGTVTEGIQQLDGPAGWIGVTNYGNIEQATFDAQLHRIGVDATFDLYGIATNHADAWYGISNLAPTILVKKFNPKCVVVGSFSLGLPNDGSRYGLGMRDDLFCYYSNLNLAAGVSVRDIVGASTALFVAPPNVGDKPAPSGGIVVLRNGEVVIAWDHAGSGAGSSVRHYSAAGALLHTFVIAAGSHPSAITPGLDDTTVWLSYTVGGIYNAREIVLATGADQHGPFVLPSNSGYNWGGPFAVLRVSMGCPPASGSGGGSTLAGLVTFGAGDGAMGSAALGAGGGSGSGGGGGGGGFASSGLGGDGAIMAEERFTEHHTIAATVGAAIGFTLSDIAFGLALITTDGAIRFTIDGTAPTSTDGHPIAAGTTFQVAGHENILNFQAIGIGGTASITGSFARP